MSTIQNRSYLGRHIHLLLFVCVYTFSCNDQHPIFVGIHHFPPIWILRCPTRIFISLRKPAGTSMRLLSVSRLPSVCQCICPSMPKYEIVNFSNTMGCILTKLSLMVDPHNSLISPLIPWSYFKVKVMVTHISEKTDNFNWIGQRLKFYLKIPTCVGVMVRQCETFENTRDVMTLLHCEGQMVRNKYCQYWWNGPIYIR